MKKTIVILLAYIISISLASCAAGGNGISWQDQFDLGTRYFSEGNYEEAIIAFTAAIEIDPMQQESYLKLSDCYGISGELNAGANALLQAYDTIGDEALIKAYFDYIVAHSSLVKGGYAVEHSSLLITENVASVNDLKFNTKPAMEALLSDFMAVYPEDPEEAWWHSPLYEDYEGVSYRPALSIIQPDGKKYTSVGGTSAWASSTGSLIRGAMVDGFGDAEVGPALDFRSIAFGDSYASVVQKLGLSELGSEFVKGVNSFLIYTRESGEMQIIVLEGLEGDPSKVIGIEDKQKKAQINMQFTNGVALDGIDFHSSIDN